MPPVPTVIPPLSSLTHLPILPLLLFQVPNVLYTYAYSLALYNGEVKEAQLLPEFCETVLDVLGMLGPKQDFRSPTEALQAITVGRYLECMLRNAETPQKRSWRQ
ncbi:UNVERIFIED_CONTAM: hypothetical protein K2H54_061460 [Gekko kuhli]